MSFSIKLALIFLLLFSSVSCSTTNNSNVSKATISKNDQQETEEKKPKINGKKIAKEVGSLLIWDVVLAATCKSALHFSIGICLAIDVIGDTGIIFYHNTEIADNKTSAMTTENSVILETNSKKKFKFEPLDFVIDLGIMALILIVI